MKLSALVLASAAVLASANAFADLRKACDFNDYQVLSQALNGGATIRTGAELKGAILGMLAEEMGPKCESITRTDIAGIPGDSQIGYEISSGERSFKITIINRGVEGGYSTDMYLSKGNN